MLHFKLNKIALIVAISMASAQAYSLNNQHTHTTIQLGGYLATTGGTQFVGIQGLVGNDYTKTKTYIGNGLLGLGYYWDKPESDSICMSYGINGFYLGRSDIKGTVVQEKLFSNLSYQYSIANLPIYAEAKAAIKNDYYQYAIILDGGIGPNIIKTSKYQERSLDGGITIPDNAFSGQTNVAFSATAGVGVKFYNLFGDIPFECGYRFFYLGQGELKKKSDQWLSNLRTGQNYANALLCSVNF